jgi:hypothetical protein
MAPTQVGVGAGIPRPIAWIRDRGGEYPPLQFRAHYLFKDHRRVVSLKSRSAAEDLCRSKNFGADKM